MNKAKRAVSIEAIVLMAILLTTLPSDESSADRDNSSEAESVETLAAGEVSDDMYDSSEWERYAGDGTEGKPSIWGWDRRLNWIRDCTDAVVSWDPKADLLLLSIETGSATNSATQCLLSAPKSPWPSFTVSESDRGAWYVPPFVNNYGLGSGKSLMLPEYLIKNDGSVLIIPSAELGIERIRHVLKDLYLVQIGYSTHSRVYRVRAAAKKSHYLTNGNIEIENAESLTFRVEWHKIWGGHWIDAIIDIDVNFVDIVTNSQDCMEIDTFIQKFDWIDLSRVDREEICYWR